MKDLLSEEHYYYNMHTLFMENTPPFWFFKNVNPYK